MNKIRPGSEIEMNYSISFLDGTVVESTESDEPQLFVVGEGDLPEKVEDNLLGLQAGAQGLISIEVDDLAFGSYDESLVQMLDRSDFDDDMIPKPGNLIEFDFPDGQSVAGRVRIVVEDKVEIDFNHPLCGHDLEFVYELVSVK